MGSKKFRVTNLVSNLPNVARFQDPTLINAWGIVIANCTLWVAATEVGLLKNYDLDGRKIREVNVRFEDEADEPTGLVVNRTNGFRNALLITATEEGNIQIYNPNVDPNNTILVVSNNESEAIYKGLAIADNKLYATDFHNNKIDVFDSDFNQLTGFSFLDPNIPEGFAVFNIAFIRGFLYVTYAKQEPPDNEDDEPGPGNGFISVFTTSGAFVRRLVSRGVLNSPWAIIPYSFCNCHQVLLVGNFGDGVINVFDFSGNFLGNLRDQCCNTIHIDGLWGLVACNDTTIFFAAGPDDEENGLVGKLKRVVCC